MGRQLLAIFAWVAILGHFGVAQALPLACSSLFNDSEAASSSIEGPLVALRESLLKLNESLKAPELSEDPLSPLKDIPDDPREIAFVLQGSYRLPLSHPKVHEILSDKQIAKLQAGMEQMKWLEKKLGEYSNSKDLVKAAKKAKVPEDFLVYLKQQRNLKGQEVLAKLQKRGFVGDEISVVNALLEELYGMKKLNGRLKDGYLPKSLQTEIDRVQEKVDTEMKVLIMKPLYTFHEVEEGAHAFRRSLRWLRNYILAYRERFSLEPHVGPLTAYEMYLRDNYSKDVDIALSSIGQIKLREMDYYMLNDMIAELRKIKGVGEIKEQMTSALIAFGHWDGKPVDSVKATEIIAGRLDEKLVDIEIRTQEILGIYEAAHSLQDMIVRGGR